MKASALMPDEFIWNTRLPKLDVQLSIHNDLIQKLAKASSVYLMPKDIMRKLLCSTAFVAK